MILWDGFSPKDYNNPRDRVPTENQLTVSATVNGEARVFTAGTNLGQMLESLEIPPDRVAIELDRAIVKRDLWGTTEIRDGAQIEIVMFVGGG